MKKTFLLTLAALIALMLCAAAETSLPQADDVLASTVDAPVPESDALELPGTLELPGAPQADAPNDSLLPIDEAHFPDAAFRQFVSGRYAGGDSEVYASSLQSEQFLDLSGLGIANLEGLQYFTGLVELNCSDNSLTALNLQSFQNLEILYCQGNKLAALDLSACPMLRTLHCQTNALTALNASACTSLRTLKCYGNQLTALDLSACASLETLFCGTNQLAQLTLNPSAPLRDLRCNTNALTALPAADFGQLTRLDCYENQLTALDLSACASLRTLSCGENRLTALNLSACPMLETLGCGGNQLTALDLSASTNLQFLGCAGNALTALNAHPCAQLSYLDCGSNALTQLDVSGLEALVSLNCVDNRLSALNVEGCGMLYELDCQGNRFTQLSIPALGALERLSCQSNSLTGLTIGECGSLDTLICYANPLERLDLGGCARLQALLSKNPVELHTLGDSGTVATVACEAGDNPVQGMVLPPITVLQINGSTVHVPEPLSVKLTPSSGAKVRVRGKLRLKATVYPSCAQTALTWKTTNYRVADVDKNGLVTGVATGTATVTVYTDNGQSASVRVQVLPPLPTKVKLSQSGTVTLEKGQTLTLKATLTPADAVSKLTWKTSSKKIATVSKKGVVKAVGKGTATITVKTQNSKSAKVKIKVIAPSPRKVAISPSGTLSLKVGKKKALKAKLTPTDAVTQLTWTSSDPQVATVTAKGVVTAVSAGAAKITVKTANGKSATLTVKVS